MAFIKHNLNYGVKVKLTKYGKNILWKRLAELNEKIVSAGGEAMPGPAFKVDEDGYYQTQMWILMETFGSHMGLGFANPFELDIFVEVDDQ